MLKALIWSAGLGISIVALLTWVYITDMSHAASTPDWTTLQGQPATPARLLFSLLVLSYTVSVGLLASLHHLQLYRHEISHAVKARLALAFISIASMTIFFGLIWAKMILHPLGLTLDSSWLTPLLVTASLVSLISCLLWAGRINWFVLWPLQVHTLRRLLPLQRQLEEFAPSLFLTLPSWRRQLTHPHDSLCQFVIYAMDSIHLLQHHPDPRAQELYRLLNSAAIRDHTFDEVLHTLVEISSALQQDPKISPLVLQKPLI